MFRRLLRKQKQRRWLTPAGLLRALPQGGGVLAGARQELGYLRVAGVVLGLQPAYVSRFAKLSNRDNSRNCFGFDFGGVGNGNVWPLVCILPRRRIAVLSV